MLIAVILVFIVILYALSGRASLLIGLAIPASFLMGILALSLMGFTVNIVVLFSLILAVGMLVDDAIIVTEFAERRMSEGMDKQGRLRARRQAHGRPGHRRDHDARRGLLAAAVLAGHRRRVHEVPADHADRDAVGLDALRAGLHADARRACSPRRIIEPEHKRDGCYMAIVKKAVRFPKTVLLLTVGLLVGVQISYTQLRRGRRVLPQCRARLRPALRACARQPLARRDGRRDHARPRSRLLGWPGVEVRLHPRRPDARRRAATVDEDVVGVIQYEFVDWRERKPANDILDDLRAVDGRHSRRRRRGARARGRPADRQGDPGAAVGRRPGRASTTRRATSRRCSQTIPGVIDISDGLPPPGVDWALKVDRTKAAQYGISPNSVGTVVQLVTTGLKLTDYRPAGVDDAVDIRLRLPEDRRTLSTLDQLRVETAQGSVPISNFVTREPEPRTGILNRIDGERTIVVQANVASGVQAAAVQAEVPQAMAEMDLGAIRWRLAGSRPGERRGQRLPDQGLRRGDLPDLHRAAGAVQQVHQRLPRADDGGHVDDRRVPGPAADRPDLRHRHVGHRHHRAGRRGGEQQHRADRHL